MRLASRAAWVLAAGATGCIAPGVFTSARTLPPGATQWGVTLETASPGTEHFPLPNVTFRTGLSRRAEVGFRAGFGLLGADLKLGLVRGGFDLALAPGVHVLPFGDGVGPQAFFVAVFVPVLAGFNLSRRASLVVNASPLYVRREGEAIGTQGCGSKFGSCIPEGFGVALGFGVRLLVSDRVALHPSVSFLRTFVAPPTAALVSVDQGWVCFGFGVSWGAQPDVSELP